MKRKRWHIGFAIIAGLLLAFLILDILIPLPEYSRGYSTIVYSADNKMMHGFLSHDDKWRIRAEYEEISGKLMEAIVYKEDKYFYYHPGVNPFSVVRAIWNNTVKGKRTIGASTITMQLARLLEPADRNIRSKISESFRALQLEWHYSKKEILLMYLNLVPYGGNIEGIKAASLIYFDQQPKELSPAQIAMLSVIPNNPNVLMPQNRQELLTKRNHWILKMGKAGTFNKEEVQDALIEGFESRRYNIPRNAPHLSLRLASLTLKENQKHKWKRALNPEIADRIYSTIDPKIQSMVESAVNNYIRGLRNLQITNCAALVIDNHTLQVRAYVGSAGFNEAEYSGQVDGIQALRSPGSTLKPAVYMLAFDRGLVSPKTIVSDVPVNYNGYRPENYDESYRGTISIENALALSLNVPAVEILEKVGLSDLNNLLIRANFQWISKNKKNTGLSLILGGCGTTLEELTGLYASFANKGKWYPLQYTISENRGANEGIEIGSPGSAYMITQILTQLKRPDLPTEYLDAANLPKIAWKTGTSYGRRDAWAIGYNSDYTVGIWTGNFDGHGVPELNGTDCAVPLLFMIFNQLDTRNSDWFFPTEDTDFRLVCSKTGMIPDTFCHNRVMETFLPGISPSIRCNHLKPIFTNSDESVSYCNECLPQTGFKAVLYPNYATELVGYYNEMQIPYTKIPEHNPKCNSFKDEQGPIITSLTDGAEYLVISGKKQHLMLKCSCENGVKTVYWYRDKKFLGKGSPTDVLYFQAEKGNHIISCSDDRGRTSNITIRVSLI